MKSNLYLIGYRGCGKTTVGPLLADRLGWAFVDSDLYLEAKEGRSIREIFAETGEASFRDKETGTLRELSVRQNHVIATGGGIILREENRLILGQTGRVIWLQADAQSLWQRIESDPMTHLRRPALLAGGLQEVQEILAVRRSLYESCADFEIPVVGLSPSDVVDAILTACQSSIFPSSKSSG